MNNKRKIAFLTLGCKLNYTETSTISKQFPENEFLKVDFKEKADVYVINTCCVTENAEKKCNQYIRQAQKNNSQAIIAVIGCYSQMNPDKISSIKGVDLVLGNEDKFKIVELLDDYEKKIHPIISNQDINKTSVFKPSYSSGDRTRSFLKVQDGCDYFCSYCTVPYARGRSRSATIDEVLKSMEEIEKFGVKEVVLTGINIGDFGKHNDHKFIDLLKAIEKNPDVERVRISSIEPDLLSDEIIELVSKSTKLMPHFHVPLQSGCDKILKAMNRKYNTALFSKRVKTIKELMPLCCIASDVIVGFPGETNEDFEETYDYIKNSEISYVHVFPYSERSNTPASKIKDSVLINERKRRSNLLHLLSYEKKMQFYSQNLYHQNKVLFESEINKGFLLGFTDNYIRVKTKYAPQIINQILKVKLQKIDDDGVYLVDIL